MARKKRPADVVGNAVHVMRIATKQMSPDDEPAPLKNPAAVELGRKGGLKGGKARAKALSKAERKRIAVNAANTRWRSQPS
jgi:hypothetical protein